MDWGHEHPFKTYTHLTWGSWDFQSSLTSYGADFEVMLRRGEVEKTMWDIFQWDFYETQRLHLGRCLTSWCPGLSLGYGDRLSIHQSRISVSQSLACHLSVPPSIATSIECYTSKIPWRAPLCLLKQLPSLADPLRLQFSNELWNTKSHLPNELWQWDLPCLPVVRALPGCLSQSLLDEPFLCTNWGEANMVLSVLKFSNMYLNMTFVIIFTQFSLGAI